MSLYLRILLIKSVYAKQWCTGEQITNNYLGVRENKSLIFSSASYKKQMKKQRKIKFFAFRCYIVS